MAFQPVLYALVLVRSIIVDDKMQVQIWRSFDIDQLQKPNKFLMPVARHAIADDLSIEHT